MQYFWPERIHMYTYKVLVQYPFHSRTDISGFQPVIPNATAILLGWASHRYVQVNAGTANSLLVPPLFFAAPRFSFRRRDFLRTALS